jgi:glyoxylase-like metal-dependent hydrolase (beta-lactamase superfamily II)
VVTELVDGVWQIDLPGVNAYVVDDDGDPTLIDTGLGWHAHRVERALEVAADGPGSVERILVTHYDPDHVGGVGRIDGLDAPIHAGEPDASYLDGSATPPAASRKGAFQRLFGLGTRRPPGGVSRVEDGDDVGGFTCFHTPGHTDGHFSYVHAERSVALLGDLVRTANGSFEPAPWVLSADAGAIRRSIRDFSERAPAFDVGAPGHGSPVVGDAAAALRRTVDR